MEQNKSIEAFTPWKDWKFHGVIILVCILCELIGAIPIDITENIRVTLLPLLYAMVITTALYLFKKFPLVDKKHEGSAGFMMNVTCLILMAKLGINTGNAIDSIAEASLPVIFSNFGDALTCLIALPLGLLLGMDREVIGLTFGCSREGGIAVCEGRYGSKGSEFRGVMGMYIVGTVFGTIVIGLLTSICSSMGIFNLSSIAIAAGCGSASMSSAGIGTLALMHPESEDMISAMATASNLISTAIAIYAAIFIALPLAEWEFKLLYPILSKSGREERKKAKAAAKSGEKN